VLLLPADLVEALAEGEVAQVLVLAARVVTLVMHPATLTELLLHVYKGVLGVVENYVERATAIARLDVAGTSLRGTVNRRTTKYEFTFNTLPLGH
jgi:hypothetical protein